MNGSTNKVVTVVDAALLSENGNGKDEAPAAKKRRVKRKVKKKKQRSEPFEDDDETLMEAIRERFVNRHRKNVKRSPTVKVPSIKVVGGDYTDIEIQHTKKYLWSLGLFLSSKPAALMKLSLYATEIVLPEICALCQEQQSYDDLGELYGPYYINVDGVKVWPPFMDDSAKPARDGGLYQAGIRIHCDCALWAPGLKVVKKLVTRFQEVIPKYWNQCCSVCSCVGASILCSNESCKKKFHYPCARKHGILDETVFKFTCKSCCK